MLKKNKIKNKLPKLFAKNKLIGVGIMIVVALLLLSITSIGIPSNDSKKLDKENKLFNKTRALSSAAILALKYKDQIMTGGKGPIGNVVEPDSVTDTLATSASTKNIRFNKEIGNLPQITESLAVWTPLDRPTLVVGGAYDYRGFYGGSLSGYYVSNDNGSTILREGGLPTLDLKDYDNNIFRAKSVGNPALDVYNGDGTFFYASMYMNDSVSGIGLAKATSGDLTNPSLQDNSVWSVIQVAPSTSPICDCDDDYFQDKPWVAVDNSASSNKGDIYVTYTNFALESSYIQMYRCSQNPFTCEEESRNFHGGTDYPYYPNYLQYSKVSVDSNGNVILTWVEYVYNSSYDIISDPPYYKQNVWARIYDPGGGVALTPPILVTTITKPVRAAQGNEFSLQPGIWSEPAIVNGIPRLYITNSECAGVYLYEFDDGYDKYADSCSNVNTYLRYIDNYTTTPTISSPIGLEISSTKHSFLPTMSVNNVKNRLDIAWYQTESTYKHKVYLAAQQRDLTNPATVTIFASDSDAEVYSSGIGDYFQIKTEPGVINRMFIHYNGNTRYSSPYLYTHTEGGTIITEKIGGNQQDNILYIKTY